ncbi:5'-3' exoribonuclease 1 [Botrytis cinerea]
MGVPKFFRWMSERYPSISQLIAENRIPEFDCLYLDMNGIIHNCTHKDSDDATFRMTEEQMFIAIFNYIEHLYGKIKPKQLFYMAVDGVAPRAKMNQQRARRFRTALDVENAREKAIKEGKEMPKEDAFDSNSITPGTEFMQKLTLQLKYFIAKKISEDVDWQGTEIVLSGHEVPGEGEHKIMEYIRLKKAQPDYDPNRRHCLYGLDADLIMLGLLSHDPHFCLLREEVTFGRQSKAKSKELEHQNFYLMHLCIVREYLELEFQELKEDGVLGFPFDLERVIDDFILMAFFVGNDFLPNLPNLHINEGALALMFKELSHVEYRFFESESSDSSWFKAKQMSKEDVMVKGKNKGKLVMTTAQQQIWKQVKSYVQKRGSEALDLSDKLPAADRKFAQDLADSLHLEWKTVQNDDGERHMQLSFPAKLGADDEEDDDEEEESQLAIMRIVKQYDKAEVLDVSKEQAQAEMERKYEEKFQEWKDKYYEGKFEWDRKNEIELTKLCENYVQGLQWVLYYYYRGVVSWPWYYQYHYSPMISDVIKGLKADVNFKLGQPFHPFEQLMGVLPDRSKKIVPTVYHDLMTNPASPIIDFYPRDFELDMNGKKMEWEAVVKIPFIDEKRLLDAMATKNNLLSDAEKFRNEFGVSLKFTYDPDVDFIYPSSLTGIFPDIPHCHCVENIFDLPTIEGLDFYHGLMDGAKLGSASLAGFPSLGYLPYNATLGFHGVNVFQSDSRNESMVVTIEDCEIRTNVKTAQQKLGKRVFVGYPFLQEGKVVKVSDELFDYLPSEDASGQPITRPHGPREIDDFRKKAERIESTYSKRLGIIIGPVESLTHVEMLKGLKKMDDGATIKEYAVIPGQDTDYASQVVVDEVTSEDQRFLEKAALPVEEEFPVDDRIFSLETSTMAAQDWLKVTWITNFKYHCQRSKGKKWSLVETLSTTPRTLLRLHPLVLSKITSSFQVSAVGQLRVNLGLNLKFEGKKLKVLGYSRRADNGWEFSNKAIELISTYMTKFPHFFAGIQRKPQGNDYEESDFPGASIKEIVAWLKTIESKNFEKVPLDAEQLDSDTVMAIEQAAQHALVNGPQPQRTTLKAVPRGALLKPSDAEHRCGNQKFALGDRVVYVADSGRVPIATRGTVVGISRTPRTTLLDVLFDVTFMSGTTLGERCSPFRGSTVPIASVLNLTNKQLIAGSRAAAEKRPAPTSTPLTANGGYGYGRGQQYRESGPPPPLRGSFRGAVSGQRGNFTPVVDVDVVDTTPVNTTGNANGTRGRGNAFAAARGGSPAAGNVAYNNVPPPSTLESRGRGRGRGGRGRGASRGRGGNPHPPQA